MAATASPTTTSRPPTTRSPSSPSATSGTRRTCGARRDGTATPGCARVREARAALRELWDAQVEGRAPDRPARSRRSTRSSTARPRAELRGTLAGVEVAHRHPEDDPTGEALARLAMPLVDAIAAGDTARFRICANDGCRWVFEDASRAGRRRWCDMATCGNRARSAASARGAATTRRRRGRAAASDG